MRKLGIAILTNSWFVMMAYNIYLWFVNSWFYILKWITNFRGAGSPYRCCNHNLHFLDPSQHTGMHGQRCHNARVLGQQSKNQAFKLNHTNKLSLVFLPSYLTSILFDYFIGRVILTVTSLDSIPGAQQLIKKNMKN